MFHHLLTRAYQTCTTNGQVSNCQRVDHFFAFFSFFFIFIWFLIFVFCVVNLVFWIISLIHIVEHDDVHDRIVWLVLVLLVPFAAWVYFFGPKRTHDHAHRIGQIPPHPQNPYANPYVQGGNYQQLGYLSQTPPPPPNSQDQPKHHLHHPHKPNGS